MRRFVITVSGEDVSAAKREDHLALILRAAIFNLDKTVNERVFPHSMSGARSPPSLHGLIVGPLTTRDPGKEL